MMPNVLLPLPFRCLSIELPHPRSPFSDPASLRGWEFWERARYTEWDQGQQGRELYDHELDRREQKNLADDPAMSGQIAELSTQLRAAVAASYPESGEVPPIRQGIWAPNLTDP